MLHINRVTLLGHAGRDPELRIMRSGDRAASFSLATTRRWKSKDGQPGEATEWHRIAVYDGAVKAVEAMVRKGTPLLVEGRLATREYQDKEGNTRYVTEVVVSGWQGLVSVLTPKPKEDDAAGADAAGERGDAETGDGDEAA